MSVLEFDLTNPGHRAFLQCLSGVLILSILGLAVQILVRKRPPVSHALASWTLLACLLLPALGFLLSTAGRVIVPITVTTPSADLIGAPLADSVPLASVEVAVFDLPYWSAVVFFGGVALGLLRLGHGLIVSARLRRSAEPAPYGLEKIVEVVAGGTCVPVKVTSRLEAPVVTGLLRPVLLFPTNWDQTIPMATLAQVVAHELAHVRSRHLWHSALHRLVSVCFWPILPVHALRRQAARAQEELCDSAALALGPVHDYARLLVSLGQRRLPELRAWPACGAVTQRSGLESRVKGLLDRNRNSQTNMRTSTKAAVAGATLATCLLLAGTQIVTAQEPPIAVAQDTVAVPTRAGEAVAPALVQAVEQKRLTKKAARKAAKARAKAERLKVTRRLARPAVVPGDAVAPAPRRTDPFDEQVPAIAPAQPGQPVEAQPAPRRDSRDLVPGTAVAPVPHSVTPSGAPEAIPAIQVQRRGVPVLRDVPIVGRLFESRPSTPVDIRRSVVAPGVATIPAPGITGLKGRVQSRALPGTATVTGSPLRLKRDTIIKGATVIIRADGTVEIQGGTTVTTEQPKVTVTKRKK